MPTPAPPVGAAGGYVAARSDGPMTASAASAARGAQPVAGHGPATTDPAPPEPKKRRFWSRKRDEPQEETSELEWLFGGAAAGAATVAHPPAQAPAEVAGPAAPDAPDRPSVDPSMAWPGADAPAAHVPADPSMAAAAAAAVSGVEKPPAAEAERAEAEPVEAEPMAAEAEPVEAEPVEAEPMAADAERMAAEREAAHGDAAADVEPAEPEVAPAEPETVQAEAEPLDADGEPAEPVEATAEPVEATAEPVEATAEPLGATGEPVEAVEPEPTEAAPDATPDAAAVAAAAETAAEPIEAGAVATEAEPTAPTTVEAAPQPDAHTEPAPPIAPVFIPPPDPAPSPPVTAAGATAATTTKSPLAGPTGRRVLVGAGIVLLAAAVAAGATVALRDSGSSSSKSSTAAAAPPVARPTSASSTTVPTRAAAPAVPTSLVSAETWLRANIPATMAISADANLVGQLQQAGFTAAHALPGTPGAPDWHNDGILVSTASTRALAASTPLLNAELAASIPVSAYGTGAQSVEVRMVFGTSNPDVLTVQAQRLADATNRRIAGENLLRNTRVTIAPEWTTLVATGGLDLRAAVVIALIADRTNVGVITVIVDPGENAAGMPARTVRLSMPSWVLPTVLPALPPGYRPGSVTTVTRDNTQLTQLSWGVTLTPQPTLS